MSIPARIGRQAVAPVAVYGSTRDASTAVEGTFAMPLSPSALWVASDLLFGQRRGLIELRLGSAPKGRGHEAHGVQTARFAIGVMARWTVSAERWGDAAEGLPSGPALVMPRRAWVR